MAYLSTASAVSRFILLIIDEMPRVASLFGSQSDQFWGRTLLRWLNSTLLLGFRSRVTLDELDGIAPEFTSATLHAHFIEHWRGAVDLPQHRLALACFRTLWGSVLAVVLPRLSFAAFSLLQPFVLRSLLVAIESPELSSYAEDALVQAFFLVYFGIAASRASYRHMGVLLTTKARGALVAEVLRKNQSLYQADSVEWAAVNLVANEVEQIATGVTLLLDIVFQLLEVTLGMVCLARFAGRACFVVLLPLLFVLLSSSALAKYSHTTAQVWNKDVRRRVDETATVLGQLKTVKMLGLGVTMPLYLQQLHDKALSSSGQYLACMIAKFASQAFASTVTPVLVIVAALFWRYMKSLAMVDIAPCLAVVALIQRPMYTIVHSSAAVGGVLAALERVQAYLELPEADAYPPLRSVRQAEQEPKENEKDSVNSAIEFAAVTLLSRNSKTEVIRGASFALSRGSVTAALGRCSAGRLALVQSCVGDANVKCGRIFVDGTIGYADQIPWIRNVSIRENIVGNLSEGVVVDEDRYSRVLHACLLSEDLKALPGGDTYMAGTNGVKLSGGQKHRISLARALYRRAQTVVLDDIFSALDRKTAVSILFLLCGEDGLLRKDGSTVVFATYLPECLEVADQLLLFDGEGAVVLEQNFHEEWFRTDLVNMLISLTTPIDIKEEEREKATISRGRACPRSGTWAPGPNRSSLSILIRSTGRVRFAVSIFFTFLVTLGETIPDVYIRHWVDSAPDNMGAYLVGYICTPVFAALASATAFAINFYMLGPCASRAMHRELARVVMRSTLAFFSCTDAGAILTSFNEDINTILQDLMSLHLGFFYMLFHVLLQIGIVGTGAPYMISALLCLVAAVLVILYYYVHTSRQMQRLHLQSKLPLQSHIAETSSGVRYIRALRFLANNFCTGLILLDRFQKAAFTTSSMRRWLGLTVDLLACAFIAVLTSLTLKYRETTSISTVGLLYLIMTTFGVTLESFIS